MDCYILGTGSSLLNLTEQERRFLDSHPRTLGMNRYYLHYEKLGVKPSALFLSDFNYHADLILRNCISKLKANNDDLPYYVSDEYVRFYHSTSWSSQRFKKRRLRRLKRRGPYEYQDLPGYPHLQLMKVSNEAKRFKWACTLQQTLYHRRGSLTVAINLMNVLYPNCNIKLLGIDLDDHGYFYSDQITANNRDTWVDEKYDPSAPTAKHPNALPTKRDSTTLVDSMRAVDHEIRRQGLKLQCCNSSSLLVSEGAVEYGPII